MAFKLPSIAMTGTKHPIHALCSPNASRGRANETHGQPIVTGIFIWIFEQNEKWLDLKLYSTQVALIGSLITDQILKKSFEYFTIYQIWHAGRMSWLVFTPHLDDDLNLISHFLSTLTPVTMTREWCRRRGRGQTTSHYADPDKI